MSFQLAQNSDLAALSAFVNRAYRGDTARQGWTHEADLLDGTRVEATLLAEEIARGAEIVMAYNDGELIGCYHFEMKDPITAYVGMITVNPLQQRKGLGKLLLNDSFDRARLRGAQQIALTVMSDRAELIAYYERRGFKMTGVRIPFEPGDDRYGLPKKQLELWEMVRVL